MQQDIDAIKRIVEKISEIEQSFSHVGKPGLGKYHAITKNFVDKYVALSKEKFSFDCHKNDQNGVDWLTPGTRFVATGMKAAFPKLTDSNLITLMRKI